MFVRRLVPGLLVMLAISLSAIPSAHASTWIIYDDGTLEGGATADEGYQLAVLFTPPFTPAKILTASVYVYYWVDIRSFMLHITDTFHNDLITPIVIPEPPLWDWLYVDLSSYNIVVSGDFYIAVEFINTRTPVFGTDNSAYQSGTYRSYIYIPGYGWALNLGDNYLIRAEVEQVPTAGVPELSLGIPIITSIATIAYLTIRKRISRRLE